MALLDGGPRPATRRVLEVKSGCIPVLRRPQLGLFREVNRVLQGNIPKREVDAANDIEGATGIKPTMVPVRPSKLDKTATD